jgi:AcrR family transcriptional regulator
MVRISKDPDTRRRELIDTAETLFLKKGYNETTISDIVKTAGVAQGTFYYYFKTKDEVLDAIADNYLLEMSHLAEKVAGREDLNAVEKMLVLGAGFTGVVKPKKGILVSLHEDRNAQLHVKIEKKIMAYMLKPYKIIVEQGIQEGFFHTDYPEEAILSIITATQVILDTPEEVAEVVEKPIAPGQKGWTKQMEKNIEALFDISERLLGAKKGTFKEQAEKMKR